MIEREFIKEKIKHMKVKEFLDAKIGSMAGLGSITIEKNPLGEKIIVEAVRPGLIIGRGGKMIQELTATLRTKFKLENPQIEVREIERPNLSASVMAKKVASDLERFGSSRFKAIGYKTLTQIMKSGALGAEIVIGGRGVPGARAHTWRFPAGYMKKSGQIALEQVDHVKTSANLRSGTVGVQVRIMHPDIQLPDKIDIIENVQIPEDVQKEIDALEKEEQAILKPKAKKKKKSKEALADDAGIVVIEAESKKTKRKKAEKVDEVELDENETESSDEKSDLEINTNESEQKEAAKNDEGIQDSKESEQ